MNMCPLSTKFCFCQSGLSNTISSTFVSPKCFLCPANICISHPRIPRGFHLFTALVFWSQHFECFWTSFQTLMWLTEHKNVCYSVVPTMSQSPNAYLNFIKSWLHWEKTIGEKRIRGKYCLKNKRPFNKSSYQPEADTHTHTRKWQKMHRNNGQFPWLQKLTLHIYNMFEQRGNS